MSSCEHVSEKMSGFIDNELTQQESQKIRVHIEQCKSCSQLHADLMDMQSKIKSIQSDGGEEAALEKIMEDLGAKKTQNWGWIFVVIGSVMMMGYASMNILSEIDLTTFEGFFSTLIGLGGLLLFISVIRQRMVASKTDKYKDINL